MSSTGTWTRDLWRARIEACSALSASSGCGPAAALRRYPAGQHLRAEGLTLPPTCRLAEQVWQAEDRRPNTL
jgi:hypothetical protein